MNPIKSQSLSSMNLNSGKKSPYNEPNPAKLSQRKKGSLPSSFVSDPLVPGLVWEVAPPGHFLGVVEGKVPYTDLGQDPHVDLQAQEGKNSQDKSCQDYHIAQIFHRVNNGAHNGFEPRYHSHGLQGSEDAEGSQGGEGAEVDSDGHVRHPDDADVQPVPSVPQIGIIVHKKPAGHQLGGGLVGIDGSKYHFCRRGVPEINNLDD